jgi:hypothetical protein
MKFLSTILLFVGLSCAASGQSLSGVSDIFYDEQWNEIWTFSGTVADYGTAYYYEATTGAVLEGNGQQLSSGWGPDFYGNGWSGVELHVPAVDGTTYRLLSAHSVAYSCAVRQFAIWCTLECDMAYDIFGYSSILGPSNTPSNVWFPPLTPVIVAGWVAEGTTQHDFGFVDCVVACAELLAKVQLVSQRTAQIAAFRLVGLTPDAGHIDALRDALNGYKKAYDKVKNNCSNKPGSGELLLAASSVFWAAVEILEYYGVIVLIAL